MGRPGVLPSLLISSTCFCWYTVLGPLEDETWELGVLCCWARVGVHLGLGLIDSRAVLVDALLVGTCELDVLCCWAMWSAH